MATNYVLFQEAKFSKAPTENNITWAELNFDTPFKAYEWLRSLGWTYQELGCKTSLDGNLKDGHVLTVNKGKNQIVTFKLTKSAI